jgi:uncharacterized protein (DUF1499 family)
MRWLWLILGGVVILIVGGWLMVRTAQHDPGRWHADPLTTERTGKPNDFLVVPEGQDTPAQVDRSFAPVAEMPQALLARFDAVARGSPRVAVVAGSVAEGHITYVQRSALVGFPDYISVRAVPVGDGAALAIWSRSRYGHSDLGVNRARIEGWLAALGQ